MTDMDHSLKDVTVAGFLDTLRDAVVHLDVVHPEALREPLALWFRATEAQIISEGWTHLLGRSVVSIWNAARAVLGQDSSPNPVNYLRECGVASTGVASQCDAPGGPMYSDGSCRCLVCARCGHHTGNNTQGHWWAYCKVTRLDRGHHFCCPGDCALENLS